MREAHIFFTYDLSRNPRKVFVICPDFSAVIFAKELEVVCNVG
jgi:hypothetical protein